MTQWLKIHQISVFLTFYLSFSTVLLLQNTFYRIVGHVWRIGRVDAFSPKGHGFDSHSSRHIGTLGKSFTHSCFGVKFRHSIRAVSGEPLSSSGLEEAL